MGGQPAAMAELFPPSICVSAVSTAYNLGIGVFGGLAPVLVTFLIKETKNNFVPAYVLLIGSAISFFVLLRLGQADQEPLD